MDSELKGMLDRANELLKELKNEYESSLEAHKVTEEAKNLTHEVLEKLKNALNHTMAKAWEKIIAPDLSDEDKKERAISFPTSDNLNSFRSAVGRAKMTGSDKTHKNLYDFLLSKQPFSSSDNQWLGLLSKISGEGKHFRLTPQKRIEKIKSIEVSTVGGSKVKWDPSSVKFGEGVKILGAQIDPKTQRIVPNAVVAEKVEVWISFIFDGYGVNAFGFCNEAYIKTSALIEEMIKVFKL